MTKNRLLDDARKKLEAPAGATPSRATLESHVAAFMQAAAETLMVENAVVLPGIGTLKLKRRRARQGRNPRTGEAVSVPEQMGVLFRPTKALSLRAQKRLDSTTD